MGAAAVIVKLTVDVEEKDVIGIQVRKSVAERRKRRRRRKPEPGLFQTVGALFLVKVNRRLTRSPERGGHHQHLPRQLEDLHLQWDLLQDQYHQEAKDILGHHLLLRRVTRESHLKKVLRRENGAKRNWRGRECCCSSNSNCRMIKCCRANFEGFYVFSDHVSKI